MKKYFLLFLFALFSLHLWSMDATMYKWCSYFAYGQVDIVVDAGDKVFALASGAIFSVDKYSEEIQTYSKQSGLNGGEIATIAYDELTKTLVIAYTDGLIDFLQGNQFETMTDLQQKSMTASKRTNKIRIENGIAYFCMPFGIMAVDLNKKLIKDTYYIGEKGADVDVMDMVFSKDSVFAASSTRLFSSARTANWLDFSNWKRTAQLPKDSTYQALAYWQDHLLVLTKNQLKQRDETGWINPCPFWFFTGISTSTDDQLFLVTTGSNGIFYLDVNMHPQIVPSEYCPLAVEKDGSTYWLATEKDGIVRQTESGTQSFSANGPLMNSPYRMRFCGDKLIMVPGGYYVNTLSQDGCVMVMENGIWSGFTHQELKKFITKGSIWDMCDGIIDPFNPDHYFSASFGSGLFEFNGDKISKWYYGANSPLDSVISPSEDYTRVDGLAYDSKGNLWMINLSGKRNIKVLMTDGTWVALDYVESNSIERARDLLIWNQNENLKIVTSNHGVNGLFVLDDNGTIAYRYDDKCVMRTVFIDQDNNSVKLEEVYTIAQDKSGALWIGTDQGVVVIDDPSALLTGNACRKIKIPRNDGTGLADYLLGTEQINTIVVDGANRKWIGTQTSGVYLVSEDGLETIHHFTMDDSPLIDNTILSLAIQPTTGRVFIGTDKGLMSFQSDAAPASEDYSNVYAYPNPVRPDFAGVITIRGLMDESIIHIVDNAGNLVCETRSNGGLAIWDGKTADGRRAASGVYTVFLNENSANKHAVTKILLMH